MKRKWKRTAIFLAVAMLGAGNHVLFATKEDRTKKNFNGETATEVVSATDVTETESELNYPEIGGGGSKNRDKS